MQLWQQDQLWELSRSRREELLQEARQAQLLRTLPSSHPRWWQSLFRRQEETRCPGMVLEPSTATE